MVKNLDLLICFLVKSKYLKKFGLKLKNEKIFYTRELNDDWYNFRFYEKNIEIIKYYILYYKLIIQNEHFFIIDYFHLNKNYQMNKKMKLYLMNVKDLVNNFI